MSADAASEKKPPASEHGRSVVDYITPEELKVALSTVTPQGLARNDWILPVPDPEAEKQTAEGELQRLLTLKSYMLLDAEKEEEFDKLTQEAREIFGVPTSLISLIDLGRQFLFSNTGAGDVRETTRAVAFCSHTILNKNGMLVVPDTKEDDRFKDSELVNDGPKLRFYAGAPLISPEGHKLGTFCVEGPNPRTQGVSDAEKEKLKEYAAKTVELMVERRKKLRDRLSCKKISQELRKHAGVATSLGDVMYMNMDYATAMRLYQESIQTIMFVEEDGNGANPPPERQECMAQLLILLSVESAPDDTRKELLEKVRNLYEQTDVAVYANKVIDGIPGLFHGAPTGVASNRPLPGLFFNEVFKIEFGDALELPNKKTSNLDELPFTVPLEECSKATLFNMGQIHYHWGSQDTALQFFHLAASVSHKISPLAFDPIDIGCVNNMAQIHLQYGQPDDAMKMLTEALDHGNRTLAAMYRVHEPEPASEEEDTDRGTDQSGERDARRTSRLRRKLARTLINIGHVHFYNSNYDAAMQSLHDATHLLDGRTMTGRTLAAIRYNMAVTLYHLGKHSEALTYIDKFLDLAVKFNGPDHMQNADALYRKAQFMFEMGNFQESTKPLEEALRIRKLHLGGNHGIVAEALCLGGKVLLAQGDYEAALSKLTECLDIQRNLLKGRDLTLEVAQTLLEIGRAYHAKGEMQQALAKYHEVLEWTKKFFGPRHAFAARILGIIGNLYAESGQADESKPFLEEATKIQQEQKPPVDAEA